MSWKKELEKRIGEVFAGLGFETDLDERHAIVDERYVVALPEEDENPGLWVLEMMSDGDSTKFLGVIDRV